MPSIQNCPADSSTLCKMFFLFALTDFFVVVFDAAVFAFCFALNSARASSNNGQNGQTELIFLLEDKGAAEDVVSALQRQNIYASFDPSIKLAWELLQKQCWQMIMLSIGLLTCSAVLICKKRSTEMDTRETVLLYLSGLTTKSVKMIYPLRITLSVFFAFLLALLPASLLGKFS